MVLSKIILFLLQDGCNPMTHLWESGSDPLYAAGVGASLTGYGRDHFCLLAPFASAKQQKPQNPNYSTLLKCMRLHTLRHHVMFHGRSYSISNRDPERWQVADVVAHLPTCPFVKRGGPTAAQRDLHWGPSNTSGCSLP